jgi:hypothetical protein
LSEANFPNLNRLKLSSNRIGNEGASALPHANFPNLNILEIEENEIGDEALEKIKDNFPRATIIDEIMYR